MIDIQSVSLFVYPKYILCATWAFSCLNIGKAHAPTSAVPGKNHLCISYTWFLSFRQQEEYWWLGCEYNAEQLNQKTILRQLIGKNAEEK